MRTKFIPIIIMLAAGFVSCIITILNKYEVSDSLLIILLTLVGFYVIGYIARKILEKVLKPKEEATEEVDENLDQEKENENDV